MLVEVFMAAERRDRTALSTRRGAALVPDGTKRHTDLCSSWSPCAPCRVCPPETRACPPRWPRQTPRPDAHKQRRRDRGRRGLERRVFLGPALLTWVLMESCSARNHSLTRPSLSDWIRSSVPCRVFSCRRNQSCQYAGTLKSKLSGLPAGVSPPGRASCWTCPWTPIPRSRPSGPR